MTPPDCRVPVPAGGECARPAGRAALAGASPLPVVVATMLRPRGGTGVQTHVVELQRALADLDLPHTLVTPFSTGRAGRDGVFAARRALAPLSGAADVAWYRYWHRVYLERALARHLATAGPAVVYCQCPVSAAAALRVRRRPDQSVVMAVHFSTSQADEWAGKGRIAEGGRVYRSIRRLEASVLGRLDGVVFVSAAARDELWTAVPPAVPTATIPNFLVTRGPATDLARRADLVTVGSLEPRKNQRYLLEVLAAARAQGHRLTLDVVGEGPDRRSLAERARVLGLQDQVRFLGYVPDAAHTLPAYRAYVHPARREPFGLALVEAMAAGLPVVAAPVGGIPQLFDEGVEGRFWDLGDPVHGARVLAGLLGDEAARARMGSAARHRYLCRYDAGTVVPVLHRFLVSPGATAASRLPAPG